MNKTQKTVFMVGIILIILTPLFVAIGLKPLTPLFCSVDTATPDTCAASAEPTALAILIGVPVILGLLLVVVARLLRKRD